MTEAKAAYSRASRIDAACDEFESAWKAGKQPRIEDYLARAAESDRDALRSALAAIDAELQIVVSEGPTAAEMERAEAQIEAHFLYRLQTVGGFGGKSDQLNAYNVFCGDPAYFARDVARYREATQETVRAVAADVLRFDARVILSIVPHGRQELALAGSEPIVVS